MLGVVLGTGDSGVNKKAPAFKDLQVQWDGRWRGGEGEGKQTNK